MVNPVDLSGFQYFLPLASFLLVFLITFVVLMKAKIGGNLFVQLLIAFIVAIIFVTFASTQKFIQSATPAVVILIVCGFFILLLAGLFGKDVAFMGRGMGIIFIVILFIVFIVTAFVSFSGNIAPYIPGGDSGAADPNVMLFTDWLFTGRVGGAILLLIVSALVAWVLVKVKG